ncbi:MAG: long-chain fatty acid--CoA ligase [Candidatus Neomarinimicrobiota bacterium]|nr:MAG: long-chain fatty acid--CoA ligase [Candidatus Neomarinimicrobiota bacterium]
MKTIPEVIWEQIQTQQSRPAVYQKFDGSTYESISYDQLGNIIVRMTSFLKEKGVKTGDKIALLSGNRFEWPVIDLAIQSIGAVLVPLYTSLSSEHAKSLLRHSEAKALFVENRDLLEPHEAMLKELGIALYSIDRIRDDIPHLRWLRLSKADMDERVAYLESITKLNPDTVIAINYTSGTTGEPKGVLMTHRNIVTDAFSAIRSLPIYPSDRFLSFLPLSHAFERMAGYYCPLFVGAQIAYAESIATVIDNAKEIHPTIINTVPRLLEKLYEKLQGKIAGMSEMKRTLFKLAMAQGSKHFRHTQGEIPYSVADRLKDRIYNTLVYKNILAAVSPRLRMFISGGAPLTPEIGDFLRSIRLSVIEGYGLTETSPIIALNKPEANRSGSVGQPIDCNEVKISEEGEILVRGDNVTQGYYKDPVLTEEAINKEGWFQTGDLGTLDEDQFLYITGRVKNLMVTSGGKNISPQPLENALLTSSWIEQVMVTGNGRNFVSALIVPSYETLSEYCKKQGKPILPLEKAAKDPEIFQIIKKEVEDRMKPFSRYEQVRKFTLLPEPFSLEKNELPPTLKVNRQVVESRYATLINEMYSSGSTDYSVQ